MPISAILASVGRSVRESEEEPIWLPEMAWVTPLYSKVKVNRAAEMIVCGDPSHFDNTNEYLKAYYDCLEIVNNWRSAHSFPLNTFTVGLRRRGKQIDSHCFVAQRIKRLSSIELKLRRFPTMTLAQMQDLGGCRAVMSSLKGVTRLVEDYMTSDIKHPLQVCDDYILNPKESGYRGVHLIYRYNSDRKKTYNSLKVEMQLRTQLQHAWATAVETVGILQRQALKSSQGDADWLRFFALTSSAFAFRENSLPIPGTPTSHQEMVRELREYIRQLDLRNRLSAYGSALKFLANPQHDRSDNHYFLIELNPAQRLVEVTTFKLSESRLANIKYLEVEKKMRERPGSEAVLVSADSLEAMRKAYPNYFLDTHVFMNLVAEAARTIAPRRRTKRQASGQLRLF
jgi:ppGpp synthetase/RelA/SpoT-type nucleotidyltranferase